MIHSTVMHPAPPPSPAQVLEGKGVTTHVYEGSNGSPAQRRLERKRRVLAADDDAELLQVVATILEYSDFEVVACATPRRALDLFRESPDFDLLLTDLQMPEMSGVELATSLNALQATLPVLIMSGSILSQETCERIGNQGWRFLPKPFRVPELLQHVREMSAQPRTLVAL